MYGVCESLSFGAGLAMAVVHYTKISRAQGGVQKFRFVFCEGDAPGCISNTELCHMDPSSSGENQANNPLPGDFGFGEGF